VNAIRGGFGREVVGTGPPAAVEIGRTAAFDHCQRAPQRQFFARRRQRRDAEDVIVEGENGRAVAGGESIEHVTCAALCFLERYAGHRSRAIEDKRQVQRLSLGSVHRRLGRLDTRQNAQRCVVAGRERVTKLLFNRWGGATAFGEGGIFYKLQDDGKTWKSSRTAIHFLLLDGAFGDGEIGVISGAGGTILFTDNSGLTWDKATLLGNTDARLNSIFFVGARNGWAVGSNGVIFHSSGGGRLWRQQESGTQTNLNDVYFTTSTNGWAVGDDGIIVRTRDGGQTWTDGNSPVTHNLEKITFAGSRGWAVGFGGTVLAYHANASISDAGDGPSLMTRN